jgi:hypothetical protein
MRKPDSNQIKAVAELLRSSTQEAVDLVEHVDSVIVHQHDHAALELEDQMNLNNLKLQLRRALFIQSQSADMLAFLLKLNRD